VRACARCGTLAAGTEPGSDDATLPPGWSFATSARGIDWLCAACTREHVRAIEAKLPEEWW
jgi:hypothetical protein